MSAWLGFLPLALMLTSKASFLFMLSSSPTQFIPSSFTSLASLLSISYSAPTPFLPIFSNGRQHDSLNQSLLQSFANDTHSQCILKDTAFEYITSKALI